MGLYISVVLAQQERLQNTPDHFAALRFNTRVMKSYEMTDKQTEHTEIVTR